MNSRDCAQLKTSTAQVILLYSVTAIGNETVNVPRDVRQCGTDGVNKVKYDGVNEAALMQVYNSSQVSLQNTRMPRNYCNRKLLLTGTPLISRAFLTSTFHPVNITLL